jgi:hypothetical protein
VSAYVFWLFFLLKFDVLFYVIISVRLRNKTRRCCEEEQEEKRGSSYFHTQHTTHGNWGEGRQELTQEQEAAIKTRSGVE